MRPPAMRKLLMALMIPAALCYCLDTSKRTAILSPQESGTSARLQAVSVVDRQVVWVSGIDGAVML